MASSLTQLHNTYPKLRTCAFIGFVIDSNKKNCMFIGNKENKILPNIHQNRTPQNITFQCNLNTIKKNLSKIPTTLQGCVKTNLPPTVEKPLDCKSTIPSVNVASVLDQRCHLIWKLYTSPKHTVQTCKPEPTASFERSPLKNNKYDVRRNSTF